MNIIKKNNIYMYTFLVLIVAFFFGFNNQNTKENIVYLEYKNEQGNCIKPTGGELLINFDSDGGNQIGTISICTVCATTKVNLPTPVKEGNIFLGWYYDKEFTEKADINSSNNIKTKYVEVVLGPDGCATNQSTLMLYAKWQENTCQEITNKNIKITFETNGGSTVPQYTICTGCNQETVNLPISTKREYRFIGWFYDEELTKSADIKTITDLNTSYITTELDNNGCQTSNSSMKLYAKWELESDKCKTPESSTLKFIFKTNGAKEIAPYEICTSCSSTSVTLPTPTRNGYEFKGWYYSNSFKEKVEIKTNKDEIKYIKNTFDEKDCPTDKYQVSVYAKWEKSYQEKGITVVYETNGGIKFDSETLSAGSALPTPTKEGYDFVGWYNDKELTHKVERVSKTYAKDNKLTLYAKWQETQKNNGINKIIKTSFKNIIIIGIILIITTISIIIFIKIKHKKAG